MTCSAWDEWYPVGSNTILPNAFTVDPGDTVETTGAGATKTSFLFDNVTTGQPYQTSLTGNSAEFVVETPEWSNGLFTSQPPLSEFSSPIVFSDASATYTNSGTNAGLSNTLTIGMNTSAETSGVPGVANGTQEAYGTVSASADTVTVTEGIITGRRRRSIAPTRSVTTASSDDGHSAHTRGCGRCCSKQPP